MDPNTTTPHRLGKKRYTKIRQKYFGESGVEAKKNFEKYKEVKDRVITTTNVSLGCNTFSIPCTFGGQYCDEVCVVSKAAYGCKKQEVENTMTEKTEAAVQRDYFTRRLTNAMWDKERELVKMFNLGVDNTPRTYKELIEKITKGEYKLDEKRTKKIDRMMEDEEYPYFNSFDGIIWKGEKTTDLEGYNAASNDMHKQNTIAKDAIMAAVTGEDMRKAVETFEAWLPK